MIFVISTITLPQARCSFAKEISSLISTRYCAIAYGGRFALLQFATFGHLHQDCCDWLCQCPLGNQSHKSDKWNVED
jgi:hypothetical protein